MSVTELRGPGLTEEQWRNVKALATSLEPRQLSWVSGFITGIEYARSPAGFDTGIPVGEAPGPSADASAATDAAVRRLTILHAGETGNGAAVARSLAGRVEATGAEAILVDMADYRLRLLKDEEDLLIVVSTCGDGDPPRGASDFVEFIEGRKAPKLASTRFAVLALGDSSYEHFCAAGRRIDERLAALGAERLAPRVDCDVDYEDAAQAWQTELLALLARAAATRPAAMAWADAPLARPIAPAAMPARVIDKHHPFAARITENLVLTGRGSTKETRHVEIALEGSGLSYEPGDALGIVPRNAPWLVEALLQALGLDGTASVRVRGEALELATALATSLEITTVTPRFIEHWARLSGAGELAALSTPDGAARRSAFCRGHHILDVVSRFPARGFEPEAFIAGLRPLQPRLYSIASSASASPDEVHIAVARVRYEMHGSIRQGVASGLLAEGLGPDDEIGVYIHPAPHFRLPRGAAGEDTPIIMIGAGTGVAPYRGFLQDREVTGRGGRSWLFFGERNFRTDFLYQTEWQRWLADGVLDRMDVAFSRDGGPGSARTYIQHRLLERATDVYAWLEDGARVYVCGDATGMAPDVHEALATIVMRGGGVDRERAEAYLRDMQRDHRYQRDVY